MRLRFVIGFFLVACAIAHSQSVPSRITASSVWTLPDSFITSAHAACDKSSDVGECSIDQMTKAGASKDAVAFTRELYKRSHGEVGMMMGFQAVGPVDFAWIAYPLRQYELWAAAGQW